MGRCHICGLNSHLISDRLGLCLRCIREKPDDALRESLKVHTESRSQFGLPSSPPKDPEGIACGICMNKCRIGLGKRGFCGLVSNIDGHLTRFGGTPERGILEWYYDPLPTNCVAWWFCAGCTGLGYPKYAYKAGAEIGYSNLAVFYGACLPEHEKLFAIIDDRPTIIDIGKLVTGILKADSADKLSLDPFILSKLRASIKVAGLDDNCKIKFAPVSKVSRRWFDGQLLKINLETGRTLNVTPDHPMLVLQQNKFAIVNADQLNIGDYVPIAKRLPYPTQKVNELDLIVELKKKGFNYKVMVHGAKRLLYGRKHLTKQLQVKKYFIDNWRRNDSLPLWVFNALDDGKVNRGTLRIGLRYSNKENLVNAIIPLNKEIARLLGYYLSEGCCSGGRVQFSVGLSEADIANEIQSLLKYVFNATSKCEITTWKGKKSSIRVDVRNKTLEILFENVFETGKDCYTKKVPWFAYLAGNEFASELVDAYLIGDGHARQSESGHKTRNSVVIISTTASEELALGINILLLKLNIPAHLRQPKPYRNTYLIELQGGKSLQILTSKLPGLLIKRRVYDIPKPDPQALVPIFELYPSFLFQPISNDFSKIYGQRISTRRLKERRSCLTNFLGALIKGDVHPIKVKRIDSIPYKGYVYDLEVNDPSAPLATFMLASGVFTHNCSFDCLFCQNWHYRALSSKLEPVVSAEGLAAKVQSTVSCICYFGGDPSPQMPHALRTSEIALEKAKEEGRILRICWESNGYMNGAFADRAAKLSFESGGTVKFDIKTFNETLNQVLCGVSNKPTLDSFRRIGEKFFRDRLEPPVLTASTLLVPGYIDAGEVGQIANFLVGIDPKIPYTLLAFYPQYVMHDLPPTSRQLAYECFETAKKAGLEQIKIGNIHLLS